MEFQGSLAHHVHRIFHCLRDRERAVTLQHFVKSLIDPRRPESPDKFPDLNRESNDMLLEGERLGTLFQSMSNRHRQRPFGEIDIARQARINERDGMVCSMALALDLPFGLVSASLARGNRNLLLILCRANNFAWSTMESILALDADYKADQLLQMQCCDEYHAIAINDARRLLSLIRLNFQFADHPATSRQSA